MAKSKKVGGAAADPKRMRAVHDRRKVLAAIGAGALYEAVAAGESPVSVAERYRISPGKFEVQRAPEVVLSAADEILAG